METSSPKPSGFVQRFRLLADSLLASVQSRVELFSVELQEEKSRLIQSMLWVGAGLFVGAMMLLCCSLTLVYLFWESARLPVLAGLSLFYAAGFLTILILFRRHLSSQPKPLSSTLHELEKDRACISGAN